MEQGTFGDQITGTVSGQITDSQVAIGKGISQTKVSTPASYQVSEAELAKLHQEFSDLRAQVLARVPENNRSAAMERVGELEEAVTAKEPDVTTMEYVKRWFAKYAPAIAGSVTGVLVNPIVGKLVQAAGDGVASEFNRRVIGDRVS